MCRDAGEYVTVQGGRTSLVAGTVPEHGDVLLSTERLSTISEVDILERKLPRGGHPRHDFNAPQARRVSFRGRLAARESATVGGMASTNAGGFAQSATATCANRSLASTSSLPDGSLPSVTARCAATTPDMT